ncbi:MAG: DUF2510 domain-containing protein [Thermoleophilia bacterium]|nr:DUF2510 domain-containing protein [Thermoleophilia bacterium]
MARRRALEPSPIAVIGGVLAGISSFLTWDDVAGVAYDNSFKVPLQFLWDTDASGGFELGVPLVIVAAVVALFSASAIEPFVFLRRLGGVVLLAAVALFVVQLGRRVGWDNLNVGVGPYLAGAGGLLALLAPSGLWPVRRRGSQRAPAGPVAAAPPPPPSEAPPPMPAGWYSDPERGGQRYWDGQNWTDHRAG